MRAVGLVMLWAGVACSVRTPPEGRRVTTASQALTEVPIVAPPSTTANSNPESSAVVGNQLFFFATTAQTGRELWVSDGTADGTRLVKEMATGEEGVAASPIVEMGGQAYFVGDNENTGKELWTSDGTADGTHLVKDLGTGDSNPTDFFVFGSKLFFRARITGFYVSDGTEAGTTLISNVTLPSSSPAGFAALNGTVYFMCSTPSTGQELCRSNGTVAGTAVVKDTYPGTFSGVLYGLGIVNGKIVFDCYSATAGQELCVSDGTAAGTSLLADLVTGTDPFGLPNDSKPHSFTAYQGNKLIFIAGASSTILNVYMTDGTAAGTKRIYTPSLNHFVPVSLIATSTYVYFLTDVSNSYEYERLWRTDGTSGGTTQIMSGYEFTNQTVINDELYFVSGGLSYANKLWTTKGTTSNPQTVSSTGTAASSLSLFLGSIFHGCTAGSLGVELCTADPVTGSTQLFKDINPGIAADPAQLVEVDGTLFFTASDGANLYEFVVDAPDAQPRKLPGVLTKRPLSEAAFNGAAYLFTATTGLWKSTGTSTTLVSSAFTYPFSPTVCGGRLFFVATDPTHGYELWTSDGTTAGTAMVKEIYPGATTPGAISDALTCLNGTLYFGATDTNKAIQLWKSDGTEAGTTLVAPIATSTNTNIPSIQYISVGLGRVFLTAWNSSATLWTSDGTTAGTFQVTSALTPSSSDGFGFVELGGRVVFATDQGLAVTDGTAAGTSTLSSGSFNFNASFPALLRDRIVYFASTTGSGWEPWVTGATTGPQLLGDLFPGASARPTTYLTGTVRQTLGFGDNVLLGARDDSHGFEPWVGTSTPGSLTMLEDLSPGALSSSPREFTRVGSMAYFSAYDTAGGRQLFRTSLTAINTPPQITCPEDITAGATSMSGAVETFAAVASDAESPVSISYSTAPGSVFPIGTTTVTATTTDGFSTASCHFDVVILGPAITCPEDVEVIATASAGNVVTYPDAVAIDPSGTPVVTYSRSSGSVFPVGVTQVTASLDDELGLHASCTFQVSVRDDGPVGITCPANVVVEATASNGAMVTFPAIVATDPIVTPTVSVSSPSGSVFPLGTTVVTATATNPSGVTASCSFQVTVRDTTSPVITCPADFSAEATSSAGAVVTWSGPAATDAVSTPTIVSSPAKGSTFPLGSTSVTATATDAATNASTCSFAVSVVDTTKPTLTCPGTRTFEATSPNGAVATWSVTASDAVSPVTVTSTPTSGTTLPIGTTPVAVTASDAAGNTRSCTFNVVVRDTTAPRITCPANVVAEVTSPQGALVTYPPATATDAASTPVVTYTKQSGEQFPFGSTSVRATATDGAGRTATCTFTVQVVETSSPVLTCPANIAVEATSAGGALITYPAPTVTDVMGPLAVVASPASGTVFPLGSRLVTASATNPGGKSGSCTFTVTVADTTPPVLSCPGGQTVQPTSASGAVVDYPPATATDTISMATISYSVASGSTFPRGDTTVDVTATDGAGNVSTCAFHVVVSAEAAPTLSCPADQLAEAEGPTGAAVLYPAPVASGAISTPVVTTSLDSGSVFPLGTTPVVVTASNLEGASSTCTFHVTVVDSTAPAITCPDDALVQATSPQGALVSWAAAAATDLVSTPTVSYSQAGGTAFPVGSTTVTATAADAAGNQSACTFVVTVGDLAPPALSCPSDVVAEATGSGGAVVTYPDPIASDPIAPPVITPSMASGDSFPLGHSTVQVSATNVGGLMASCSFEVVVQDTTPPRISCPADQRVQATSADGATTVYPPASAEDSVSEPALSYSQDAGTTFGVGETTVVATATDAAGNHSECRFEVVVGDLAPPVISCPADRVLEATGPDGAVATYEPAFASDPIAVTSLVYSQATGTLFPVGSTSVTATATNVGGFSASCTFEVQVRDTTAPTIQCPASISAQAVAPTGATISFPPAVATDAVSTPALAYSQASGTLFPVGQTTVTATASDAAGNAASCSFDVTVGDLAPPTISCPPSITTEATSPEGAPVAFDAPTASDPIEVTSLTTSWLSGATFPTGTRTVTATAMNVAGLTATCSFDVTVRDTTPPSLTCPVDLVVQATSPETTIVSFPDAAASDAVSAVTVSWSRASGTAFPVGTTPVTALAIDASDNTSECTFLVTVADLAPPSISCPASLVVEATDAAGALVTYEGAQATDPIRVSSLSYSQSSGTQFERGITVVTATATNPAGLSASCSFDVTVRDTTPPAIACPADLRVQATSAAGASASFTAATASDAVSSVEVSYSHDSGASFPVGTTAVTATATDEAGNAATCSFEITVADLLPPTITCPADVVAEATGPDGASVTFPAAQATDPIAVTSLVSSAASGTTFALGTTSVTVTAMNVAGLSASCAFGVRVQDRTSPAISCPPDLTIQATSPTTTVVAFAPATASDAVSSASLSYSQGSGTGFPLGRTEVTAIARDEAGNTSSCSFQVEVADLAPPTIVCPFSPIVEATSASGAVATFEPARASDPVGVSLTYSEVSGSLFALGTTSVTATATNTGGHTASCSFEVTVRDTTPPSVTCPEALTVQAASPEGALVEYPAAIAHDSVSEPTLTYSTPTGGRFPPGMTTVDVSATDAASNTARCSFTVLVTDLAPPTLTCPAPVVIEATSAQGATASFAPAIVVDPLPGTTVTYSQSSDTQFAPGVTTVRVTATNAAALTSECTFTVTVQDTVAPTLTCPADLELQAAEARGTSVAYVLPVAEDAVTTMPPVTADHAAGSTFPVGTTEVRLTATDAAGNEGACSFHVTVRGPDSPAAPLSCSCSGSSAAPTLLWLFALGLAARRRRALR